MHDLERCDHRLPDAIHLLEPRAGRGQHLGKGAELADKLLGERLGVAARKGAVKHHFEQLVVLHRVRRTLKEALAQTGAVTVIMRPRIGEVALTLAISLARRLAPNPHPRVSAMR